MDEQRSEGGSQWVGHTELWRQREGGREKSRESLRERQRGRELQGLREQMERQRGETPRQRERDRDKDGAMRPETREDREGEQRERGETRKKTQKSKAWRGTTGLQIDGGGWVLISPEISQGPTSRIFIYQQDKVRCSEGPAPVMFQRGEKGSLSSECNWRCALCGKESTQGGSAWLAGRRLGEQSTGQI